MRKTLFLIAGVLFCAFGLNAQIFYKVSGNGLEKPSYLFGTHHLAPLSVLTENEKAMKAFKDVAAVVTEIDMTQDQLTLQSAMVPYMLAPQDSTLSKVLRPEDLAKADSVFQSLTGLPIATVDPYRPMLAATNISMMVMMKNMPEFIQNEQLDTYICGQGAASGKKALAFETAAQQAEIMFASIPVSEQAKSLMELVNDPQKAIETSKKINEAYFAHDLQKLLAISLDEDENPEFMKKLLDERNADWLRQLPEMMKDQDVFVGVGALHLAGEQGLVEGLRRLGYTVESAE
ncbi:MAG: TraB/GumN family protein [Bacteroidales bacterium]|nr:TraB/GumN family protein [Bacteroidales bacterium]MBD5284427.1 TraB/GumN family protein [Bacteroides sp.]